MSTTTVSIRKSALTLPWPGTSLQTQSSSTGNAIFLKGCHNTKGSMRSSTPSLEVRNMQTSLPRLASHLSFFWYSFDQERSSNPCCNRKYSVPAHLINLSPCKLGHARRTELVHQVQGCRRPVRWKVRLWPQAHEHRVCGKPGLLPFICDRQRGAHGE